MAIQNKSILFVGQGFYNTWYLSRELRKLGWRADLINIDTNPESQKFYHGQDLTFEYTRQDLALRLNTYIDALEKYQIFHFCNRGGIYFLRDGSSIGPLKILFPILSWVIKIFFLGKTVEHSLRLLVRGKFLYRNSNGQLRLTWLGFWTHRLLLRNWFYYKYGKDWDIELLKVAGKKIGYSNNGCLDGVLQTSFSKWGPVNTCKELCKWYGEPNVCSDHLNRQWGEYRNRIADYQCNIGSNKVDFNDVPQVLESPWFYCLDIKFWNPEILIPSNYILPYGKDVVKIYHSVGNFEGRSDPSNRNIKCTHIYLDLIDRFKKEGLPVELIFFHGIPNKIIRYYQVQADIVVDMLTFGFFGANIREAMMLGKPAVCYLRPEWLETMREEIPDYVDELPVISATPETIDQVLRDLINNKEKRESIGRKSREFAVKWHGSEIAAKYFDRFLDLVSQNNLNKKDIINIQKEIYN